MRYFIPLLLFLGIILFLWKGLRHNPHELPSALLNKPVTVFSYPSLTHKDQNFTEKQFIGHMSLLNVWATWCATCRVEHSVLMDIARSGKVVIYGLNYKDDPKAARNWLEEYGDPYQDVISDEKGKLAIDFGVYGAPETFLIDSHGIIRYKYVGAISIDVWQNKIEPEVRKWMNQP